MLTYLYHLVRSIRPRQWIKNISIAAPLIFSGNLFVQPLFIKTAQAIIIFSIISSAVYLFNDIVDRQSDRKHPFKKFRPIASGVISVNQAIIFCLLFLITGLYFAAKLSSFLLLFTLIYIALQIAYSFYLKHIAIIDVFVIATGFIIRVYAGGLVINAHMSIWFLICVIATSLLIAVGKRRAELSIITDRTPSPRIVLSKYSSDALNSYVTMFANASFLSWSLFTFFAPSPTNFNQQFPEIFALLPNTLAGHNKWLMSTIPIVIYTIMRYQKIIFDGSKAESPERILLTDKPLLTSVIIWGAMIIAIIYIIPAA